MQDVILMHFNTVYVIYGGLKKCWCGNVAGMITPTRRVAAKPGAAMTDEVSATVFLHL